MGKDTSTNAFNKKMINDSCGMAFSLAIAGGRWKPAEYQLTELGHTMKPMLEAMSAWGNRYRLGK